MSIFIKFLKHGNVYDGNRNLEELNVHIMK